MKWTRIMLNVTVVTLAYMVWIIMTALLKTSRVQHESVGQKRVHNVSPYSTESMKYLYLIHPTGLIFIDMILGE